MKSFLVQHETYAKWQSTITPDEYGQVILIEERKNVLGDNETHSIRIIQPNNPHARRRV